MAVNAVVAESNTTRSTSIITHPSSYTLTDTARHGTTPAKPSTPHHNAAIGIFLQLQIKLTVPFGVSRPTEPYCSAPLPRGHASAFKPLGVRQPLAARRAGRDKVSGGGMQTGAAGGEEIVCISRPNLLMYPLIPLW